MSCYVLSSLAYYGHLSSYMSSYNLLQVDSIFGVKHADILTVAEIMAHWHIAALFLSSHIYAYCRLANELLIFLFTYLQKVYHKISPWWALYIAPPEVELRP